MIPLITLLDTLIVELANDDAIFIPANPPELAVVEFPLKVMAPFTVLDPIRLPVTVPKLTFPPDTLIPIQEKIEAPVCAEFCPPVILMFEMVLP